MNSSYFLAWFTLTIRIGDTIWPMWLSECYIKVYIFTRAVKYSFCILVCEALIHIRQKEQITDSQGRSELGLVTRFYSAVHTSNACLSLMCNVFSLLSSKNFAHQLFKRMSNKNSRTYEAMILSLLKVIIEYTWEHRLLMFRVAILSIFYSVVTD